MLKAAGMCMFALPLYGIGGGGGGSGGMAAAAVRSVSDMSYRGALPPFVPPTFPACPFHRSFHLWSPCGENVIFSALVVATALVAAVAVTAASACAAGLAKGCSVAAVVAAVACAKAVLGSRC